VRFASDTAASRYWFLTQRKLLRWASRSRQRLKSHLQWHTRNLEKHFYTKQLIVSVSSRHKLHDSW
jgi:hypothetical protein